MKLTIKYIILMVLFAQASFSQTNTKIILSNFNINEDSERIVYQYLTFTVNGILLDTYDSIFKIPINENGIDTIKVVRARDNHKSIILTHFKENELYKIKPNPCSDFEIIPEIPDSNKINYVRLIVQNPEKDSIFSDGEFYFPNIENVKNVDTTHYYQNFPSDLCLFASTNFKLCKAIKGSTDIQSNKSTCNRLEIQFLHSEKYSIYFNCKNNTVKAKFDGYFDKFNDKVYISNESGATYLK